MRCEGRQPAPVQCFKNADASDNFEAFFLRVTPRSSLVNQDQLRGYFLRQNDRANFSCSRSRPSNRFSDTSDPVDGGNLNPLRPADLQGSR
jgi:hypothetical protein